MHKSPMDPNPGIVNILDPVYTPGMASKDFVTLTARLTSPPMPNDIRREAGYYIRCLQEGEKLSMPISRPMPSIGTHCHELRISNTNTEWRFIYRIDKDAIILACNFKKVTRTTPKRRIKESQQRLKAYDKAIK